MNQVGTLTIALHVSYAVSVDIARGRNVLLLKRHYVSHENAVSIVADWRKNQRAFGYEHNAVDAIAIWQPDSVSI